MVNITIIEFFFYDDQTKRNENKIKCKNIRIPTRTVVICIVSSLR